ncbi:MAG: hypothetical protein ACXAC8_01860 [Candidatus Hodarchaeales archaeon]
MGNWFSLLIPTTPLDVALSAAIQLKRIVSLKLNFSVENAGIN